MHLLMEMIPNGMTEYEGLDGEESFRNHLGII
jgi:hypothetical protein